MTRYLIAAVALLSFACEESQPDPLMNKAFDLHEEAILIHDSLEHELEKFAEMALSSEKDSLLQAIQEASATWEGNLVEVPGFEHHHDHDHGHDHDHAHDHSGSDMSDLPAEEMVSLQQAMLNEARNLLGQARQLAVLDSASEE